MTMNVSSYPVDYISTDNKSRDNCMTQADSTEFLKKAL